MMKKQMEILNFNPVGLTKAGGVGNEQPYVIEPSELSTPKITPTAGDLEALIHKGLSTPGENHGLRRVTPPRGATHRRANQDRPQDRFSTVRRQFMALKTESEAYALNNCVSRDIAAGFTEQIIVWVKTQTPAQLASKRTIAEIIHLAGLTGRTKAAASVQQVGVALRRAGFEPTRDYTKGGHNRRYWIYIKN